MRRSPTAPRADPIVQRLLEGDVDLGELEQVTREHGRDLIRRAPHASWKGRVRGGTLVTAARAEAWFFGGLTNAAAAYLAAAASGSPEHDEKPPASTSR